MTKKILFLYFCLFIIQTPLHLAKLNVPLTQEKSEAQETKNGQEVVASQSFAFPLPKVQLEMQDEMSPRQLSLGLKLLVILTLLTLAPSIMIMMTPFTRIIIVLSFTRRAIGTQSMPSDKMMVSLAIFLTIFQMAPIFNRVQDEALTPFLEKKIEYKEAFVRGMEPFRKYMRRATREEDLKVFVKLAQGKKPKNFDEVSTLTLIPAFIISEFKTGFQFGVVLFLPFLMLDMVIATTLMSMGMMMLPPAMVSTPFKLLLFVLIDGWGLIVNALMKSIIMT